MSILKSNKEYNTLMSDFMTLRNEYRIKVVAGKSIDSLVMKKLKSKIDSIDAKLNEMDKNVTVLSYNSLKGNYESVIK